MNSISYCFFIGFVLAQLALVLFVLLQVKGMICKFLSELDAMVGRLKNIGSAESQQQIFFEEWATLTWNVLCVTSRLQANLANNTTVTLVSSEDKVG